jgi:hypothetical protein
VFVFKDAFFLKSDGNGLSKENIEISKGYIIKDTRLFKLSLENVNF